MPNNLIATFHDPEIRLFDSDSLEMIKHLKIAECLSLETTLIPKTSVSPCHDSLNRNMFLISMRIFPNDLKKISHKSIYDKPYSGYEDCIRPG